MNKENLNRELYMNVVASFTKFRKALTEYIHTAEYPISTLYRDLDGNVSTAIIPIEGGPRVIIHSNTWEIMLPEEDTPINPALLESWEGKEIDGEISYHTKQLNMLLSRRAELNKNKQNLLLCNSDLSIRAKQVLMKFCEENGLYFYGLTAKALVDNYTKAAILRVSGCGKTTFTEICKFLEDLGLHLK